VNRTPVNSPEDLDKLISQAANEGGAVLLIRDGKSGNIGYISVPLQ